MRELTTKEKDEIWQSATTLYMINGQKHDIMFYYRKLMGLVDLLDEYDGEED